jgi:hypothetical protein
MAEPLAIDGGTGGGAPTGAELDLRIAEVVRRLLAGARRSELIAFAAQEWGISARSTDRLLAAAREQLRQDWDRERSDLLVDLLGRLDSLEREARKAGAYAVSLGAINSLARLAQLHR